MNAKFLELDVPNPGVPSNNIDVKSPESVSLPLLVQVVSVLSVFPIKTGVQIVPTETTVSIVPIETTVATREITSSQANDMLDPPVVDENAWPIKQVPEVPLRRSNKERIFAIGDDF